MKNIIPLILSKYNDLQKYKSIGNGIYKDLENKRYVITLRFELEEGDSFQHPLEDILNKYYVNCTDYIFEKNEGNVRILEAEIEDGNDDYYDSLETIIEIASLVHKHVYNKEYLSSDGKAQIRLNIE